ncbi:MAG: M23 family metallopeptidase [Treponema sp.]|nr:M23 family metallopeptidase [Treponema sp.]
MKKILALIFSLSVLLCQAFAKSAVYQGDDYCITLDYNDSACPGDAIFVKMKFTQGTKKTKVDFSQAKAELELSVEGKTARTSPFFSTTKNAKNSKTMLAGIPLSSWWTENTKTGVKVLYSIQNQTKEFELPFKLRHKEFVTETIELDENNTSIKTDTSVKRMEQIQKLNAILGESRAEGFWTSEKFIQPVKCERRTSFFADRRTFKYTTGNSSTSLHYGIDYGVPEKTEVAACAGGKVVLAETRVTTGWSVVIEHVPGLYSLYYHMSELKVKEGDMVKQGQVIGLSGSTGLATGPHLHWEVRLNSEAVNPDFFTADYAFNTVENHN